jgi:hypothetical protein
LQFTIWWILVYPLTLWLQYYLIKISTIATKLKEHLKNKKLIRSETKPTKKEKKWIWKIYRAIWKTQFCYLWNVHSFSLFLCERLTTMKMNEQSKKSKIVDQYRRLPSHPQIRSQLWLLIWSGRRWFLNPIARSSLEQSIIRHVGAYTEVGCSLHDPICHR